MKILIKDIIVAILIITLVVAFVVAVIDGLHKAEEVKCLKLQGQSLEYPNFYLTSYEKEMCDFHSIKILAPVQ